MREYIKAFGLALMICSRSLTQLLDFPRSSLYVIVLGFVLAIITSLKELFNRKKIALIFYIGIFFLISLVVSGMNKTTVEYFLYFICFGITSLLVPTIKNFKYLVRFIILIGIILVWSYVNIDYAAIIENVGGVNENVSGVFMDISYKTLVFVISGILLAITDDNLVVRIVSLATAVVYATIAFVYGARGALLSIGLFLLIFWIIQSNTILERKKRINTSAVILLAFVVLFTTIITITYEFLDSRGIEARSIERIYEKLSNNESMSQGRDILYKEAVSGIVDSPIWGHGIGSFHNYSGTYPHNLILQLLYEGGLILTIPLLIILIKGFLILFSFKYIQSYRYFLLLLFCSGVIELFLSSFLWMSICLWFFYGQVLLNKRYVKTSNNEATGV